VTAGLARVIAETWPGLPTAETHFLADTLVRLAISYAALPSGTPRATADGIAEILGPYIDAMLAAR
jgi:Bacterial Tetracyclin repressor,  C-terminal domain